MLLLKAIFGPVRHAVGRSCGVLFRPCWSGGGGGGRLGRTGPDGISGAGCLHLSALFIGCQQDEVMLHWIPTAARANNGVARGNHEAAHKLPWLWLVFDEKS